MNKLGGSSLIVAAILLILIGLVLRLGIIAWLIDMTGLLLIVLGVVLGLVGLFQVLAGSRRGSRY